MPNIHLVTNLNAEEFYAEVQQVLNSAKVSQPVVSFSTAFHPSTGKIAYSALITYTSPKQAEWLADSPYAGNGPYAPGTK